MLKEQILEDLKKTIKQLGFQAPDIVCTIPKNPAFGDYSTNLALQLAKLDSNSDKQSPNEIANEILGKFSNPDYLEKVEIAGGGFINFFIKPQALVGLLNQSLNDSNLAKPSQKGKRILVEFTDPNPFKEFHIGHLFSNSVGESLSRLVESTGAEVKRVNYFGDVGMHAAKSIWGMKQKMSQERSALSDLAQKPLNERVEFLGQAYAIGAQAYEEEKEAQEQIKKVNLLIYIAAQEYLQKTTEFKPQVDYKSLVKFEEKDLLEVSELFEKGRTWSLEYFETIYAKLGTKFDDYYPESIVGEYGLKEVLEHMEDQVFEKSEGAIIFPGEKFGLHNRVFVNSLGLPTYEAKELGLAVKKYQDYQYDKSIIVTGNEIKEYFQVLMKALSQIRPDLAQKTIHIPHGMVRMTGGKMSSRKGNVLTFDWLFEQVQAKVKNLMTDSNMTDEEKQRVIQMVSIGAIKFSMLKSSPHINVIFDLEKSVSMQGDSGPYLQYTHARARSVLRNAGYSHKDLEIKDNLGQEERELLMKIGYFPDIIEGATQNLRPSVVVTYLIEFAKIFNLFYQKYPIIKAEQERDFRLALTEAVAITLKKGLYLLGIEAPERM